MDADYETRRVDTDEQINSMFSSVFRESKFFDKGNGSLNFERLNYGKVGCQILIDSRSLQVELPDNEAYRNFLNSVRAVDTYEQIIEKLRDVGVSVEEA